MTILNPSTSTNSTQSPMQVEISRKGYTSVVYGQKWPGFASCLRRTRLVGSPVEQTSVQTCSGSPDDECFTLCSKMVKNAHLACSEVFEVSLKDGRPLELVDNAF